jgi:hypothetical protein
MACVPLMVEEILGDVFENMNNIKLLSEMAIDG